MFGEWVGQIIFLNKRSAPAFISILRNKISKMFNRFLKSIPPKASTSKWWFTYISMTFLIKYRHLNFVKCLLFPVSSAIRNPILRHFYANVISNDPINYDLHFQYFIANYFIVIHQCSRISCQLKFKKTLNIFPVKYFLMCKMLWLLLFSNKSSKNNAASAAA